MAPVNPRMKRFLAATAALGLAGIMSLSGFGGVFAPNVASAANGVPTAVPDGTVIRKVDTSSFPRVVLEVLKPSAASAQDVVGVKENNRPVNGFRQQTLDEANAPVGIVLLIDTSEATKDGNLLNEQKKAALAMIAAKKPNEKFAVVAYNGSPRSVVNFTGDAGILTGAIQSLQSSGDAALWDGIKTAGALLLNEPDLQPNVIVMNGTKDARSQEDRSAALVSLQSSKAALFAIGIRGGASPELAGLGALAKDSGGRYVEAADAASTSGSVEYVRNILQSQSYITYTSSGSKSLEITVAVAGSSATAHASPNTIARGPDVVTSAQKVEGSFLPGGIAGMLIIAIVAFSCVGLLLYALIEIFGNEKNHLLRALSPYSEAPSADRDISRLADSDIIKKAVAQTARIAEERGFLQTIQTRLEQAALPLKAPEALFFTIVLAVVMMVLGGLVAGPLGIALAFLVFLYMPIAMTSFLAKRRRKKFTGQLPDTLQLLAGSLRAGYSLVQGFDAVSKQCEAPMSTELQRAMSEARLGRPIEDALQEVADRMGSDDFEWAVMAIKIQREVGGNLAELLMTVSETMIARERMRREVKALTAEGRISAVILIALPPGVGLLVMIMNPAYMKPMLADTMGQLALVGAGVLMGIGWFVMQKLMKVEA